MSLWRVTVEDDRKDRWVVLVLSSTEIGAKRTASKTVGDAHAIEATTINPFKTGALLSVRENDVQFAREEAITYG